MWNQPPKAPLLGHFDAKAPKNKCHLPDAPNQIQRPLPEEINWQSLAASAEIKLRPTGFFTRLDPAVVGHSYDATSVAESLCSLNLGHRLQPNTPAFQGGVDPTLLEVIRVLSTNQAAGDLPRIIDCAFLTSLVDLMHVEGPYSNAIRTAGVPYHRRQEFRNMTMKCVHLARLHPRAGYSPGAMIPSRDCSFIVNRWNEYRLGPPIQGVPAHDDSGEHYSGLRESLPLMDCRNVFNRAKMFRGHQSVPRPIRLSWHFLASALHKIHPFGANRGDDGRMVLPVRRYRTSPEPQPMVLFGIPKDSHFEPHGTYRSKRDRNASGVLCVDSDATVAAAVRSERQLLSVKRHQTLLTNDAESDQDKQKNREYTLDYEAPKRTTSRIPENHCTDLGDEIDPYSHLPKITPVSYHPTAVTIASEDTQAHDTMTFMLQKAKLYVASIDEQARRPRILNRTLDTLFAKTMGVDLVNSNKVIKSKVDYTVLHVPIMPYDRTSREPLIPEQPFLMVPDLAAFLREAFPDWNVVYDPKTSPYMIIDRLGSESRSRRFWRIPSKGESHVLSPSPSVIELPCDSAIDDMDDVIEPNSEHPNHLGTQNTSTTPSERYHTSTSRGTSSEHTEGHLVSDKDYHTITSPEAFQTPELYHGHYSEFDFMRGVPHPSTMKSHRIQKEKAGDPNRPLRGKRHFFESGFIESNAFCLLDELKPPKKKKCPLWKNASRKKLEAEIDEMEGIQKRRLGAQSDEILDHLAEHDAKDMTTLAYTAAKLRKEESIYRPLYDEAVKYPKATRKDDPAEVRPEHLALTLNIRFVLGQRDVIIKAPPNIGLHGIMVALLSLMPIIVRFIWYPDRTARIVKSLRQSFHRQDHP